MQKLIKLKIELGASKTFEITAITYENYWFEGITDNNNLVFGIYIPSIKIQFVILSTDKNLDPYIFDVKKVYNYCIYKGNYGIIDSNIFIDKVNISVFRGIGNNSKNIGILQNILYYKKKDMSKDNKFLYENYRRSKNIPTDNFLDTYTFKKDYATLA